MPADADDLRVLVGFLRVLRNWQQAELAAAAGLHPSTVCRFEEGEQTPSRASVERLTKAAGLPIWAVDEVVLRAIQLARSLVAEGAAPPFAEAGMAMGARLERDVAAAARAAIAEFLAAPAGTDEESEVAPSAARAQEIDCGESLGRLADSPDHGAFRPLPEWWQEFHDLVERLCDASVRAAADEAALALRLAELALRVAELAPGDRSRRAVLCGHSWGFIANAQRVGGDLLAADASFATSRALRQTQSGAADEAAGEWRLLDLEASLRREQRQFDTAIDLLDRAVATAPVAARGRILMKRAFTLEQAGRIGEALAALRQAEPLVAAGGDARERWVLNFNLLVNQCHLGEFAAASSRLPALQVLTAALDNKLDHLRLVWLGGRIAAGLGRKDKAVCAFEAVRREFSTLLNGYDTALVSLELAILHLEEGRRAEVTGLAGEMLWIFSSQRVHREALAALRLFCDGAAAETVTVDLARRLLAYFERTRNDRTLEFEPGP